MISKKYMPILISKRDYFVNGMNRETQLRYLENHQFQDWLVDLNLMERVHSESDNRVVTPKKNAAVSWRILGILENNRGYMVSPYSLARGVSLLGEDRRNAVKVMINRLVTKGILSDDFFRTKIGYSLGVSRFEVSGPLQLALLYQFWGDHKVQRGQILSDLALRSIGDRSPYSQNSVRTTIHKMNSRYLRSFSGLEVKGVEPSGRGLTWLHRLVPIDLQL